MKLKNKNLENKNLENKKIGSKVLSLSLVLSIILIAAGVVGYKKKNNNDIVLTVNNNAVTKEEYKLMLQNERKENRNKEEDKKVAVRIKIQQLLAKEFGAIKDVSYESFLKDYRKFKEERDYTVKKKGVIYGPVNKSEKEYYDYVLSNMIIKTKENMLGKDIIPTKEQLLSYYETTKERSYRVEDNIKVEKLVLIPKSSSTSNKEVERFNNRVSDLKSFKLNQEESRLFDLVHGEQVFNNETAKLDSEIFEKVKVEALKLSVGQVSNVIEEGDKFYIIRLLEKTPGGYKPYEECKDSVLMNYVNDKYEEIVSERVNKGRIKVSENFEKMEVQK